MFVWGTEKCDVTHNRHPLNPNRELVLKNMNKVFSEITLNLGS